MNAVSNKFEVKVVGKVREAYRETVEGILRGKNGNFVVFSNLAFRQDPPSWVPMAIFEKAEDLAIYLQELKDMNLRSELKVGLGEFVPEKITVKPCQNQFDEEEVWELVFVS